MQSMNRSHTLDVKKKNNFPTEIDLITRLIINQVKEAMIRMSTRIVEFTNTLSYSYGGKSKILNLSI